ncbi:MAG: YceI family protein [Deltaproteobacteria bacterium]|nr:YceI family protein [Deltaproteobacteria bacterium]
MFVLASQGCENPAKDKPKAQVGAAVEPAPQPVAQPATKQAPPAAATETIPLDPSNSKIEFVAAKVTKSHPGGFSQFKGSLELGASPEAAKISLSIDMSSVYADAEKLTAHLKTPDFFDVAKYPTALFESTEVRAGGEKGATHTIVGNLDLHGVKRSISFPATLQLADGLVSAASEFVLNRKDFGIVYPGMPDDLIRDEVVLKLAIKAPRGQAGSAKPVATP